MIPDSFNIKNYLYDQLLKKVNLFKMDQLFEEPSTYEDDDDNIFVHTEK